MDNSKKEQLKKLTIHYNKKDNRSKFLEICKRKYKDHTKWIKSLEDKLPQKYLNSIKSEANKYAKDLEEWSIIGLIKEAFKWTKEALLPDLSKLKTNGQIAEKLISRFVIYKLFGIVVGVNTILAAILVNYFGASLGSSLTAILVAPITEELYKWLTIKMEEKEWGWFVFNVGEFVMYIVRFGGFSFKNIPFMIMRFICTLSHLLYTKTWADKDLPKGLGSFFHFLDNGPIAWVVEIVSIVGLAFFGTWGYWCASIGTMLLGIKLMLKIVLKLKHPEKSTSWSPSPVNLSTKHSV